MDVGLYPVVCMWEVQNENNRTQMIWLLTLAFSPVYPLCLSEQKLEVEKLNTVGLITLSFMCA